MPKQVSAGADVRRRCSASRCRTSTAPTTCSMLGANPLASNGSLLTAPDMRGRLRGDPRARRQGRRRRPAAHAHRRGGRRAPLHPARAPTRCLLFGDRRTRCSTEGLADLGRARRARRRARRGARRCARRSRPRPSPTACGIDADDDPPHRPRARRRRARRRLRPHRHLHPGVRHARELARRRAQRAHRQPRPRRAARCSPAPPPARANTRGTPGSGRGVQLGRWHEPRARRCPRSSASCPSSCLAEEIDTPGEGQIRALITIAGNPVLSTPERAAGCERALDVARVHGQRRHLPQRDDAPRRRDPAGARRRSSASHYDLALYQLAVRNVANYSPPVFELDAGDALASGRSCCGWPAIVAGQGADADVEARRRLRRVATLVQPRGRAAGLAGRRPRPGRADRRRSSRARARAAARPACCAPARTATGSAPTPTGSRSTKLEAEPARHRPRAARAAPARGAAHAERARSSSRPSRSSPTSPRLRAALDAAGATASIVLVGRRQLRSNNSWMHNLEPLVEGQGPLHAARPPRRRRAPRPRRRRRGAGHAPRRRRSSVPVEVTDAIMPGVVEHPARLGPRRSTARARGRAPRTPASTPTCWPTRTWSTRCRATPSSTASRSSSPPCAAAEPAPA